MTTPLANSNLVEELRRLGCTSWCAEYSDASLGTTWSDPFNPLYTASFSHAVDTNFDLVDATAVGLRGIAGQAARSLSVNKRLIGSSGHPQLAAGATYTVLFSFVGNANPGTPASRTPDPAADTQDMYMHRFEPSGGSTGIGLMMGRGVGTAGVQDSLAMGGVVNWHVGERCRLHIGDDSLNAPAVCIDGKPHVGVFQVTGNKAWGYLDDTAGDQDVDWTVDMSTGWCMFSTGSGGSQYSGIGIDVVPPAIIPQFLTTPQRERIVDAMLSSLGADQSSAASAAGGNMKVISGTVAAVASESEFTVTTTEGTPKPEMVCNCTAGVAVGDFSIVASTSNGGLTVKTRDGMRGLAVGDTVQFFPPNDAPRLNGHRR